MTLEEERDDLRREKRGLEEMLFQVLDSVGEPVEVPGEKIKEGIKGDKIIDINYHEDIDAWVFQVLAVPDEL